MINIIYRTTNSIVFEENLEYFLDSVEKIYQLIILYQMKIHLKLEFE
jgi:hypothetical protein